MNELAFPQPQADDPEDVAWNLQTGATMWGRGDRHEAVRWIRRAAEAASDAGSDDRALALARAAADLTTALELPPSVPPPAVAPAPAPMSPKPPPVAPRNRPSPPPVAPLAPDEATIPRAVPMMRAKAPPVGRSDEPTVLDYEIPAGVAEMERKQPPPSRRPPPPPARSSPSAAPPSARSSPSAAPPPSRSSPSASPPPTRSSPSASSSGSHRPRQAFRVAVTPSPDDRNLLLVRVLGEGEALPADAHEAMLVALDPGVHLTSKKR